MAEWLKAPDSKSGLGETLTWVRIPPLPPPICHIFRRWRIGEVYGDFVLTNNDFVGDYFNDFPLFFGLHRLPVVVKVARLGSDFLGWLAELGCLHLLWQVSFRKW